MRIAVTGATGFLGRYIVSHLAAAGHRLVCWHRPTSDLGHFPTPLPPRALSWIEGTLNDRRAGEELVAGADAVVHSALDHPSGGFRGEDGDLIGFVERNVVGTLRLIEQARAAGVERFVYISSCAVHDVILDDRPLDETHPTWSTNHYGAHKAAVENFVTSFGLGAGYPICALRPTGIYGLAHPAAASKWYGLVRNVVEGRRVEGRRGGKEVHAADVARAVEILLEADPGAIAGRMFNCYDRYVSEYEVARLAQRASGASGVIDGEETHPKHQIDTARLRSLGMTFGGTPLLERTIDQLVEAVRAE
ncbi:NAD-dependent epimerase/dehydratase family protein [Paludisphaera borealis]|uniref:3 beta-hydroxysteroid dehydrogenase/Delta 5-->4-isomerase n=1 Tax=Paludisphaera borealis TaxID=1387353 RepID=A0A1U7CMQ3_9BACT|nr:NAD(P)-dependent oxidoreductase [Paludisphaera borealis]APW60212.1 3 beta-hydroxysteroid dehydrogenase/Delta 5-->4-isomerase [Paludisphaera borealis]